MIMTLNPVPAGAWRRIAEEVQHGFTKPLQLEPHDVELYCTGQPGSRIPTMYSVEVVDTIIRTARTYGIECV